MLFKLAVRNIARSAKDYAVYFFTLIVGVAIFYVFNAIESQSAMLNITSQTRDIVRLMTEMLSGVSVFVSFVLGFLIVYASRFLMKRRNREFALYLLLGMGKRKVSFLLFLETLFVGLCSLAAGLVLGVMLSQLMSILVANMFEADMTRFHFVFSGAACARAVLYFGIMYLFVMLFQTVAIRRCRLIDLIQSGRRSERVHNKNPWFCVNLFLIGVTLLGFAYYQVTADYIHLEEGGILRPIAFGCIGTFLVFFSLSGLFLKFMQARPGRYYKGLNCFTLRQVSSQINTAVLSMTIICIMLFVTICVLTSAFLMRNYMQANLDRLAPAELQLERIRLADNLKNAKESNAYSKEQLAHYDMSIPDTMEACGLSLEYYMSGYECFFTYRTQELTFRDTMGGKLEEIQSKYKFLGYETQETIMRLSDYNRMAKLYGNKTFSLAENEYLIVADFQSMVEVRNICLSSGTEINVFGKVFKPKYNFCQDGFVKISSVHTNDGLIVLPDEAVDESARYKEYLVGNYSMSSREEKRRFEDRLQALSDGKAAEAYIIPSMTSRLSIADTSAGLGAMVTFIGLYLGVVFLISGAAILETFGMEGRMAAIGLTAAVLVVIYGGYFVITYLCSKNMIREKK